MGEMTSGVPTGTDGKSDNSGISALLRAIMGSGRGPIPDWASQKPDSIQQLLRQLSANAGQMPMPGGQVGAVLQPSFGSSRPATTNYNPANYGQRPGLGEATFFQQSMKGGMAPISAITPLGVPKNWNPFATYQQHVIDQRKNRGKGGDGKGGDGNGSGGGTGTGGTGWGTVGDLIDGGK
jgi:hypothetical protein